MRTPLDRIRRRGAYAVGPEASQDEHGPQDEVTSPFYNVSDTCQIPNLAFLHELVFGRRAAGTFVEVGAYDGYSYSNTSCLAEAGWVGLYVEPVPAYAKLCRARYKSNKNIRVANIAVGRKEGSTRLHLGDYLTTADDQQLNEYAQTWWGREKFASGKTVVVPVTTLDGLLAKYNVRPGFDLLVVDVEGGEVDVFAGFDMEHWKPKAMIVELKDAAAESRVHRQSHVALSRQILAAGYEIVFKDGINTYFVRTELRS
jgi:FkbM family methyltransferase